jgi:hypothetical protein
VSMHECVPGLVPATCTEVIDRTHPPHSLPLVAGQLAVIARHDGAEAIPWGGDWHAGAQGQRR